MAAGVREAGIAGRSDQWRPDARLWARLGELLEVLEIPCVCAAQVLPRMRREQNHLEVGIVAMFLLQLGSVCDDTLQLAEAHRAELALPRIAKRTQGATATMRVVTAGSLSLVEMAQLNRDFRRIFRVTRGQLACAAGAEGELLPKGEILERQMAARSQGGTNRAQQREQDGPHELGSLVPPQVPVNS